MLKLAGVHSQKIDNTASFREITADKYFRINYDNDYFAAKDKNYTQGYSLEIVLPALKKNPVNKVFPKFKEEISRAGLVFEHTGFTPSRYEKLEIQHGDRPFAAAALLKSFYISANQNTKQRLASHLSVGLMGPAAKGREIQTGIHSLINGRVPYGWQNQIKNHLVFNYGIDYEKELVRVKKFFVINANGGIKLGNLYTNATLGLNTIVGLPNNPYTALKTKKYLIYGYFQPQVTLVGFDGTMQGSVINNTSVYTIAAHDINRIVGQLNYGIVFQLKSVYLEYSRANITREIKNLTPAAWGGIKIGFRI